MRKTIFYLIWSPMTLVSLWSNPSCQNFSHIVFMYLLKILQKFTTKIHCSRTRISKSFIIYPHSNNLNLFFKFWSGQSLPFLVNILTWFHLSKAQLLSLLEISFFSSCLSILCPFIKGRWLKSPPTFAAYSLLWVQLALSNYTTPLNTWLYFVIGILYFRMAQLDWNWHREFCLFLT